MTENAVTSVAVPLVEGIATKIALFLSLGILKGFLISSKILNAGEGHFCQRASLIRYL